MRMISIQIEKEDEIWYNNKYKGDIMKKQNEEINVERFNPSFEEGLTLEEVSLRKSQGLTNHTKKGSSKSILSILVDNILTFSNLMYAVIFVLLFSAGASISQYIFVIILTVNTCIGIFQEIRSKQMIDKLSLESAPVATVIRHSERIDLPFEEIVLDDIIYLTPGRAIPTDAILVSGEVEVNESQLTGESIPVRKHVGDTLYSGSFVVSGNCYGRVERVGSDNSIEKIASAAKKYSKPESEIKKSLGLLLRFVCIIFVPTMLILYYKAYFFDNPVNGFFHQIFAVIKSFFAHSGNELRYHEAVVNTSGALLGMIPQGLILLTTVALAVSVVRLGKHKTLVQDMYCIEMLAHVDVLCLDKTGTITDGSMTVTRFIEMKRDEYPVTDIIGSMNEALQETNMTARALEAYFGKSKKFVPVQVHPFSSETKFSAVTFVNEGTFILGAPEFVLKGNFESVAEKVNEYANQGYRVLALAYSSQPLKDGKVQKNPKLVALILIEDQIRKEAYDTIKFFKENGVAVKVISGDNPVTVSEVSRRVGIENAEDYISLEGLSDEEVALAADHYTVFGRVKPNQKKILVQALKKAGHTVAMTGDGVNDILALKEADCSIAMASGCDAVRNVAQLVLLDSNFASMPKVVAEGRRVINNIQQSAVLYLTKTLLTMFIAIFTMTGLMALTGNPNYPFQPIQMIIIEMLPIGLASFFLALQPNHKIVEGHFMTNVIKNSLPGALSIAILTAIICLVAKPLGISSISSQNELVTVMMMVVMTNCLLVLYHACKPFNKVKIAMFAFVSIFTVLGLIASIASWQLLGINFRTLFSFVPLVRQLSDGSYYANPLLLALLLASCSFFVISLTRTIINYIGKPNH